MNRISRPQMFMEIAQTIARRSDCRRLNVGAVLVKNNRIVSIGYNGSPAGQLHCEARACQGLPGECQVIHAEKNCLLYSPLPNDLLYPATMYVTHSPCEECAGLLLENRIAELLYGIPYRDTTPLTELVDAGMIVHQVLPNGIIIPWAG